MPRFSANLSMMFADRPLLERFAAAKAAGFEAVEIQYPYSETVEAIGEKLAETGLALDLINMPSGDAEAGDRGLAVLPGRRTEYEAAVANGLGYARALGVQKMHLTAGNADPHDSGARAAFVSAIRFACERAGPDITMCLEPLNGRDAPGYFLDSYTAAADIIDELALPNLRLQFDFYHRQIIAGDVMEAFRKYQPMIGHVQFAGVPGRVEPDRGELAYDRIFTMLDELGHQGYVGAEYKPVGRTEDGLGWFAPWRA